MEAVTALLDDGMSIGLLLQGKKIRDDNKTLSQTGLSCRDNLGNLGFTLEPAPDKLGVPLCFENPVMSNPTDSTKLSERLVTYNFSFLLQVFYRMFLRKSRLILPGLEQFVWRITRSYFHMRVT